MSSSSSSSPSEVFLENFYNLNGLTIAERRRNFYQLLNNNKHLKTNPAIVDEIVNNLTTRTFLEELFKLDLLIYYRRIHELFNILKDGNEIFISKIVKHLWFFEQAFKHYQPEQLVNEILPSTSFAVRMKILKKLSICLQGEQFDQIFDNLIQRYGQFIAHQFLFGCSDMKIEQILKQHRIQLNNKQLMILYKRNQQLILKYFEYVPWEFYYYKEFFNRIFVDNFELYQQLHGECRFSLGLGKRLTRRIVDKRRNDVIQSPDYYRNRINLPIALRKLRSDSRILLNNAIENTNKITEIYDWIKIFPRKYQWQLFKEIIMSRYKLDNYIQLIDERLIKIIDDNRDRDLIVKRKIAEGHQEYIKYLDLNESIPMIKEKINLTSKIPDRQYLLNQLVETCYFHNDMNALYNILKFFAFKHRYDDEYLQIKFLQTVKTTFGYHHLNDGIWKCLQEIFEMHKLKFERTQTIDDQLAYIEYLFNTNQTIDDDLVLAAFKGAADVELNRYQHSKNFWKYLLMFFIMNGDQLIDEQNDREIHLMAFDMHLISQIEKWNRRNPDDKIIIFNYPRIANNFKLNLLKDYRHHSFKNVLNYIILNKTMVERNEYLAAFWGNIEHLGDTDNLSLLLKYDVDEIRNNFDKFAKWCLDTSNDRKFWYKLKKYGHLQFDKRLIDLCLNNLETNHSIECLSVLMSGEKYKQLSDEYSQIASRKLDLKNENDVKLYRIRCSIAANYKYTKYNTAIYSLLNYCIGDYLGSALTSLYSFMYHLPEDQLRPLLEIINNKAVSFRKHTLFLSCELCDYDTVKTVITRLNQNEGSQSIQKRLIKTTIQYLKKNPTDQIFELVKLNIQFTNKDDDDLLQDLIDISQLPKQYVAKYGEFIWEFFDKSLDKNYRNFKQQLLSKFNGDIIEEFRLEFCQKIIDKYFLKPTMMQTTAIHGFISKLFTSNNKQLPILQQIIQMLDTLESNSNKEMFMSNYFHIFMKSDSVDFLQVVVDYWEKLVDPIVNFSSYVNMFFVKLKISYIHSIDVDAILERIVQFFNDLIRKYSQFIVYIFANLMDGAIAHFTNDSIDKYVYYEQLLTNNLNNMNVVMLVLHWLPGSCSSNNKLKYNRIIQKIQTIQDPAVQINYKIKFEPKCYKESFIGDDDW